MNPDELAWLGAKARLNYHPQGTRLLSGGDGAPGVFHVVLRGEVRIVAQGQETGHGNGVDSLLPGECFPLGALIENRPVVGDYVAAVDTFCYEWVKDDFDRLLGRSTQFADFCARRLAHLLQESLRLTRQSAGEDAHARHNMSSLLSTLLRKTPVTCAAGASLRDALTCMRDKRIGSIVAVGDDGQVTGILTERDVLDRVVLGDVALDGSLGAVMTPDPVTVDENASAFDAALMMAQHAIRHLPVTRAGRLIGVVSERDLFSLQRIGMREVGRAINHAKDAESLARAAADVRILARNLRSQGMAVEQLTQLIVAVNDRMVDRAIALVACEFHIDSIDFCWIALGSEGRMEQTISTDQDNGIIFDAPAGRAPESTRERLLPFALRINELLAKIGFPLCKGGIMASNPKWCLSLAQWKERFADWLRNPTPDALLNAAIFFDFRPLSGSHALAEELRTWLLGEALARPAFRRMLAANALGNIPPLNFFGELASSGTLDLKGQCARPFIDGARVLALAAGVGATQTAQRLRLVATEHGDPRETETMIESFHFIQSLRMARQFEALDDGGAPNEIDIASLGELDRRILKETLRQARKLQSRLALDYAL